MKTRKGIFLSIVILLSQGSITTASADITDYVSFPYNETTFDSMTRYSVLNYTDSLAMASWNRVRKGPAPFTGELSLYFTHNVNIRTYTFQTELISPSGKPLILSGRETKSETTYSVNCWGTYCKTTYLVYPVTLPENSEVGKYSLRFTAKWLGTNCVGTVCESGVPKSQSTTAIGALEITGAIPTPTTTPTPTPTPTSTPTSTPTATPTSVKKAQTITVVKPPDVSIKANIYPLTAFASSYLPMKISMATPGVCYFENGNFTLLSIGTCKSVLNQSGDNTWEPAPPVEIVFEILPAPAPVVVKTTTITCVKGKLTKKVTALKPKCPTGYKKK
jgi:hypothetical protein